MTPIKKIFEQMYQRYPRTGRSRTKEKRLESEESQPDPQIQMWDVPHNEIPAIGWNIHKIYILGMFGVFLSLLCAGTASIYVSQLNGICVRFWDNFVWKLAITWRHASPRSPTRADPSTAILPLVFHLLETREFKLNNLIEYPFNQTVYYR